MRGHYRRQLVLNGTAITRAAAFVIDGELRIASIQELKDDIFAELRRDEEALNEAVKELDLGQISDVNHG